MAKVTLDFEHKAIIAIIFMSLFGFFFLCLGVTFTALGYTGNYILFRTMGPSMAGIAILLIVITAYLGYKVSVIREEKNIERQRQMAILQQANQMRMKHEYLEREEQGHFAYAGEEEEHQPGGLSNPVYQSSQGHLPKPASNQEHGIIPVHKPPIVLSPAGYSAHPETHPVCDSLNSSHSSIVGSPALGLGVYPYHVPTGPGLSPYNSASPHQVAISTHVADNPRPRRPAPGIPVSHMTGSALP